MTDFVFINPPYSYTDNIKTKTKKRNEGFYVNYPHLGLAYLAASLEKNGFSAKIIEASASFLTEDEIMQQIKEEAPPLVGITVTTMTLRAVYALIQKIKQEFPKIIIILGGAHISVEPELIKKLGLQFGFIGEADHGLVQLCKHILREKQDLSQIKGLIYLKDGELVVNERDATPNLDAITFPARHLLPNEKYFSPVINGLITSMVTSRGCPFNCIYCSRPSVGKICRFRSAENIIEEIIEVKNKFKVKYINFEDDTFTMRKENVTKLCNLIIEKGIKIKWGCQTRANLVDEKLLKLMHKSGCIKISFGVEAGSERVRYVLNKKIHDDAFRQAFKWCRKIGIETTSFFMFGHPTETLDDLERTISFACELSPTYALFNITYILPGSPLFAYAQKEGLVSNAAWEDYMYSRKPLPVYIPHGLSKEILENFQKKAFRRFYLSPKYIIQRIFDLSTYFNLQNKIKIAFVVIKDLILS
ncbi:MAG: radical SAM protein [bacterium]|nr:radical SAM protein [bacterium]